MKESIDNNKLTGDYMIAFSDILNYMQSSNISINSKFSVEVSQDMKDMLLSAQKNQLAVSNIIGKDIKSFCEDIVKTHNTKRVKISEFLKTTNRYLGLFILWALAFQIVSGNINLSIILVFFLTWFLFHYIFNFIYKQLCFKFKGLKNQIKCMILIGLVSMVVLSPLILLIIKYCDLVVNGYYAAGLCLLCILINHIINKKLDKNFRWYSYLR
mgnify:CR=1 FL=1